MGAVWLTGYYPQIIIDQKKCIYLHASENQLLFSG